MKKTFLMLFSLCLSAVAIAQTELGFKAGIGVSDMVAAGELGYDIVFNGISVAYQVGGYGSMAISDKLLGRTEILFNHKGGGRQDLYYLSVPILLQYKLFNHLNLEAGPEFGYLLLEENVVLSYNTFDFGIDLGANLAITRKVMLGMRYNIGMVNIMRGGLPVINNQGVIIDEVPLQNRALLLTMSYQLANY